MISKISKRSSLSKLAVGVLLCGAASVVALPAFAQTETAPPPQTEGAPPYGGPRRGGPEQRAEMLQRQLNLTPDQTAQVKILMGSERTQMEALRSNNSLSNEQMHTQMMAIRQDGETRLRALLTPDQITKYDAMRSRIHAEGGQRGDGPPPQSPQL